MAEKSKKPTAQLQRSLPDDIIFNEILPRLPVERLLKLTLVSKSWRARIKSPAFMHAHYHHHRDLDRTSPCFQLVYMSYPFWQNTPEYTSTRGGVWSIGSSGGLIHIFKRSIPYLWNPFVRTMERIPAGETDFDFEVVEFGSPIGGEIAMGFGRSVRDHRVARLWWKPSDAEEKNGVDVQAEVSSVSADSWRSNVPPLELGTFLERRSLRDESFWFYRFQLPTVAFEGSVYWLGCWDDEHEHKQVHKVVRYDLDKELFEATVVPRSGMLAVVDGCLVLLSLVSEENEGFHVKVYVRNESELGSSFSASKDFYFRKDATEKVYFERTMGGRIILAKKDGGLCSYDCYVDGNNLGFKFRDKGVKFGLRKFDFIPIQMMLGDIELFVASNL